MSAFLFSLVAVFLTSLGSRDQILIARLSGALGRNYALLVLGWLIAVATAIVMTAAGAHIGAMLPGPAKTMLAAFALIMASAELAWPNRVRKPAEPTRSLGAIGIVLLARQIGDASRFLIFAFAAGAGLSWFAGAGGAIGGMAAVFLGWALRSDLEAALPLRTIRIVLAVVVGMAAAVIALSARGLV